MEQVQNNNIGAEDTAKVNGINALLADPQAAINEPSKPVEDDDGAEASAKPVDSEEVIDPELAFDTDQPAQVAPQNDADPESEAAAEEEVKPVTLKDLAETLEVDSKDLYEIEIPIGQGDEAVSLGALKDSHKELLKVNAERASYDEHRRQSENELLVSKRQVAQLIHMGQTSGLLSADTLQQIDNIHNQNLARERTALMDAIPEWKDPQVRDNDFADMVEVLAEYGISKVEVEQAIDHRLAKFVHDMTKRLKAVKAAKNAAKNPPKNIRAGGRSGKAKTPLQLKIEAAKGGSGQQKAIAIDSLLTGK